MMRVRKVGVGAATSALLLLGACGGERPAEPTGTASDGSTGSSTPSAIERVAALPEMQITGVAISRAGRLFVNAPYWLGQPGTSVVEILPDGELRPYPSEDWFGWTAGGDADPRERFVCVQSVWVDDRDRLWILDPAAPNLAGVVPGGPKLVAVDLATDTVERVYRFDEAIARPDSYLNDVRVDTDTGFAYITDSGAGGLVVLELASGAARRVLADHPSTLAEPGVVPEIEGIPLRAPSGEPLRVHADGIALDPRGEWLYYHALTGRHLYRVPTRALRDASDTAADLGAYVEDLGATVVTDGMLVDFAGNVYHTAIEQNAIVRWTFDGRLETVVEDPRIRWPDSFALDPDGRLHFTTSQIHRSALLGNADARVEPYQVFRVVSGKVDR